MARAVLITGGNRGDRSRLPAEAEQLVESLIGRVVAHSRCYESAPWGFEAETNFWNQVLVVETALAPRELLEAVHEVERRLGRNRLEELAQKQQSGQRYASRTMDVDILFYDSEVIALTELQIPHPRLCERSFVLEPLCELMPAWRHPQTGERLDQIYEALKQRNKDAEVLNEA